MSMLLRRSLMTWAAVVAVMFALVPAAVAQVEGEEVDVALVLAVDISYSMDVEEQRLQKEGYIEALNSPEVLNAIEQGMNGKIAIAYFEWANALDQRMVLNWTIVDGKGTARAATDIIAASPLRRAQRTSISGALNFGHKLLADLPFRTARRVIDVSGDGPNNAGMAVESAREKVLADGITINGLPVMLKRQYGGWGDIANLDEYYQDCVVGGPGSFVIPIKTMEQFRSATKQKIIREIASLDQPVIVPAQAKSKGTDCMVGERMVRERWGN